MAEKLLVDQYCTCGNVQIPAGDIIRNTFNSSLLYDEFIVYDVKQIRQRYLMIVKTN